MPARLLPPLTLLLLALAAAEEPYWSVSGKSNSSDLLLGPRFYLDDLQCLGYIPPTFLCASRVSLGLEVRVTDRVAFPMIEVDASLRNASIARHPDAFGVCPGRAHVTTRLRCLDWRFSKFRGERKLPSSLAEAEKL